MVMFQAKTQPQPQCQCQHNDNEEKNKPNGSPHAPSFCAADCSIDDFISLRLGQLV